MKIRNKIQLYFSVTSILLVGVMFLAVFWLFSEYREEDFQQRQKDKIITTLQFITEIEKYEKELTEAIDRLNINSLLNEKLLIFDKTKKLIYSSLDDVPIGYSNKLLEKLNERNEWIEMKDGLYDVVAIYFTSNNNSYYGISKAYDEFGYTKLNYLRSVLIIVFIVFTILIVLLSTYFANLISKPISKLAALLEKYRIGEKLITNNITTNTYEIEYLNAKFDELVTRTNNAYNFQKNSIHHISHQLKTPITILISELERINQNVESESIKCDIDKQIVKTKSLAEVINTLLEISKIETGQQLEKKLVRTDEIIFDCISELNTIYPEFIFEVNYIPSTPQAESLVIKGSEMLIRQAFLNLLNNCISYSRSKNAEIKIDASQVHRLKISFINVGKPVSKEEEKYLFSHFFRGENSRNKIGFGLGLVLTKNIIELHDGSISYTNSSKNINTFEVEFKQT